MSVPRKKSVSKGRACARPFRGKEESGSSALIAVSAIAIVTGLMVVASSFLPLFWGRADTATVPLPSPADGYPVPRLPNTAATPAPTPQPSPVVHPELEPGSFTLSIPALDYWAVVNEGVGLDVLDQGPGHYPGTPWPGERGNVGIAAHNLYWLAFDRLQEGDKVILATRYGDYSYAVTASEVVEPSDISVLAQGSDYRLTMTTCWPLWAGAYATKRLVFFATLQT